MSCTIVLAVAASLAAAGHPAPVAGAAIPRAIPHAIQALVTHTYEARIRLAGRVTTTQVRASDAGQAKKLAQAQFPTATVLSVKKVD